MFGQDRLRYEIARIGMTEPEEMVERILDALLSFRGRLEQRDDTTLLAVKYHGAIRK
jgi:serine phosphatase RsbU (regulator of sigma subunit)